MNSQQGVEWPDWTGQTAIIVATGPSAADVVLDESLKERVRCIVIKPSWRLAPWADVLYGADRDWWIANRCAPEFKGLKVSASPSVRANYPDVRVVRLRPVAKVLTDEIGILGCGLKTGGGHSGFQAINLAVQFGAKRIILVGFDMTLANGTHWTDDYLCAKPDAVRVERFRQELDGCADQFSDLGIDVINCAQNSALTRFPKMSLSEALR